MDVSLVALRADEKERKPMERCRKKNSQRKPNMNEDLKHTLK